MNWLQKVMYGRYGADQLSLFLVGLYLVLSLFARLVPVLQWIGLVVLAFALFRTFSRNFDKRRAENNWFTGLLRPLVKWVKYRRTVSRDKEHRYFRCPNCGQQLRAPRGKGNIHVTCRSCGVSFDEHT